jgi:aspartyl-tRNA(Asn)/glutamyl-tRNA(Gln) amidotransferase subunit A
MSEDLHWASMAQLGRGLAAGKISSVEITNHLLARISALDGRVQSFVHVAEDALAQARASDKRRRSGGRSGGVKPLEGIPVAIKDNYFTTGMPTTAGTTAPGISFPQDADSACVERLRAAGCVLVGKTRTHEFAWGTVSPPTANPWDLERIPGGSSGGSGAAVAAGFAPMGMGSDTGGSIRIPASFCGTVGLKPTFGRVSRHGIVPHTWSLDHPGALTRTVEDAALTLNVLAGYDARDPACQDRPVADYTRGIDRGIKGLRIAVIDNHFMDRNTAAVQACIDARLADLKKEGATIHHVTMPILDYGLAAIFAVELASSSAYHDHSVAAGHSAFFQPDVRDLVEMGRLVSAVDYLKAEQVRARMADEFRELFEKVDAVVTPTEPLTAWKRGATMVRAAGKEESVLAASWRLTYPFNLTGLPAISVPCGFDDEGMPIGMQVAAPPFAEEVVLRCGRAIERIAGTPRRPALG